MTYPSTFSIVAYAPEENAWGIAVASKFLAVGSVVPWARAGAGAVATQSYANTSFGPQGLELMEKGISAQRALNILISKDPQSDLRQVGVVDRHGGAATYTGKSCYEWAGGLAGEGFAAQGNILANNKVIPALVEAYQATSEPFMWRLQKALFAGDRAGGDKRGRQSAAIYIVKPEGGYGGLNDRWVDYRVDDHPDPVFRLGELLALHDLYFGESPESEKIQLAGETLTRFQNLLIRLGYYQGASHGQYDKPTRQAMREFIGNENFEERTDFENGRIDKPVLEYIEKHFGSQA